jgi:hypothetical protein
MLRQFGAAAVVAVVAIGVALVAIRTNRHGSHPSGNAAIASVPVPPQRISSLEPALAAAGCKLRSYPNFGQTHTTGSVNYKTNPPTSGPHFPAPASDGAYAPRQSPPVTQTVHALEHGRVEIEWRPGLSTRQIGQLNSLFDEQRRYHGLLFENRTGMPYAVAAVAWQHLLGCPKFNSGVFDAIRAFRSQYTDKAPEFIPGSE